MTERLEYRVKLRNPNIAAEMVTFNVSPDVSESRTVNYKTVDPIHAPGQIYAFVNSSSRTFQLSAVKLISRTRDEAQKNLNILWMLRGWTLPAFGTDPLSGDIREKRREETSRRLKELNSMEYNSPEHKQRVAEYTAGKRSAELFGVDLRGSPPQVLQFSAYAHDGHFGNVPNHINRVPVVITSLNIPYPSDVDYFPTPTGVPMPSIMSIDISLAETHSPKEYENFSLTDYKNGKLAGF
jgi:hypothetical protein